MICTRDRGARLSPTLRSILSNAGGGFEVIVVDQSDGGSTEGVVRALGDGTRVDLRYERTPTRGLSRARNVGLQVARAPIVAMTDDDCTVAPSWTRAIVDAFERQPKVALLFGNVEPAPVTDGLGFIPAYERSDAFVATRVSQKAYVAGMGACMAMRRDVVLDLGGFDPRLGAGSPCRAGEEVDLTLRVLASGWWVQETPEVRVVHHGFRPWSDAARCAADYWYGAGAAMGKHLRSQPNASVPLLARLAVRFLASQSTIARSLGPAPMRRTRLTAFLRGLTTGARAPAGVGAAAASLGENRPRGVPARRTRSSG